MRVRLSLYIFISMRYLSNLLQCKPTSRIGLYLQTDPQTVETARVHRKSQRPIESEPESAGYLANAATTLRSVRCSVCGSEQQQMNLPNAKASYVSLLFLSCIQRPQLLPSWSMIRGSHVQNPHGKGLVTSATDSEGIPLSAE